MLIQEGLKELEARRGGKDDEKSGSPASRFFARLARPEIWQPLLIVLMLVFVQQFSGTSVLRAYVVSGLIVRKIDKKS